MILHHPAPASTFAAPCRAPSTAIIATRQVDGDKARERLLMLVLSLRTCI
jgi:hypothetical protein